MIYEEDQFGNLVTTDNTTVVTASLSSGDGPLKGTTSVTVVGGVATFTNLSDNTAETLSPQLRNQQPDRRPIHEHRRPTRQRPARC